MPTTLDTTPGGANSNSYADLAEAAAIVAEFAFLPGLGIDTSGYLGSAMTANSNEGQKVNLVEAARVIDGASHAGMRQTETQAREYPRVGLPKPSLDTTIPDALKRAQVAQACATSTTANELDTVRQQGVESYSLGNKSVKFKGGAAGTPSPISNAARTILEQAGLLTGVGGSGSVYLPRA